MKISPEGIMSSEKVSNSPWLCPVKGQKPRLGAQTRSRDQFSSLSRIQETKRLVFFFFGLVEMQSKET